MTLNISGFGSTVPPPGYLYPSQLLNSPNDIASNTLGFPPGGALYVPAQSNDYLLDLGQILSLEFLDPVTGIWRIMPDIASRPNLIYTKSNGVDRRIANATGTPVAAIVANGGSGFVQASTTLTSSAGGSIWQPVVGGSLTVSTVTNVGANYAVAPFVLIPAPTPAGVNGSVGGVPATATATIANGTVSGVTMDNFGAGYMFVPTAILVPSPFDPNFGTISQATVTLALNAQTTGAITAALVTNRGAPLATVSTLSLTAGGAGTGATITPQVLQTIISSSVVAGGGGFGAGAAVFAVGGGATATPATNLANPAIDFSGFRPSSVVGDGVASGGGITSVVFNGGGGLFLSAPTAALASGGTIPTTLASVTFAMGASRATGIIQNL